MTSEELKAITDKLQQDAKEARQKLYKAIGRETAYMVLGGVIASAVWGWLTWLV